VTTPPPPEDGWPAPDAPIAQTSETVVVTGGPPPDRRIGAGMLLALGAIALVALGFVITYLLVHRHHDTHPTTVVVTTAPRTQTAAAGVIVVPDVRSVQADRAAAVLQSVGLTVRRTLVAGEPAGSVVTESPQPGAKVAKGSEVQLGVARGTGTGTTTTAPTTTRAAQPPPQPTTASVPDLSSLDEAGAAEALGKAGLLASLAFVPSQDPLGTVEGQGKPAGTNVQSHSHVQVNVSTGPGIKAAEAVPTVIGNSLQEALSAINGAHLRLIYLKLPVTSRAQAGKVVQQSPLGGAHAPQNAQVIVYLGAYRAG
jgi:beta-lactam-binding protein with PASTA domain